MFRTVEDFLEAWKNETESTLKIFRTLTNDSLDKKMYSEGRTLARLAWHITETLGEMPQHAGLQCAISIEEGKHSINIEELVENYTSFSQIVADAVKTQWNNAMLLEEVPMYGEQWKRGLVLSSLILHQTHHRAQMTVLMRQAGLKVPGLYGPAKEEWAAMGMQPAE